MAVQAQNPSTVFLLNSGRESHDYPLQPQPALLFDHSHMIFNSGENASSRQRNENSDANRRLMIGAQIEQFCAQQSHSPPPFLDLHQYQLQNQNRQSSSVISTVHQLAHADQPDRLRNLSRPFPIRSTDDFAYNIKQQKQEVDKLLQTHAEELRRELAAMSQRQYGMLMSAAEESVTRKLKEKEAEVEKAKRKENELEARACQLKVEVQIWQAKARSQEAAAASLQAQLQRAVMGCGPNKRVCSMTGGYQPEDAESVYADPDQVNITGPSCRACKKAAAAVVLLPCRHLCLCRGCDQVGEACPLCFCSRNFSVEVNLS